MPRLADALAIAYLAAFVLFVGWVTLAWLTDPTSDAGCDDPRMTCTPEGNRPTGFVNTTTTTPESE